MQHRFIPYQIWHNNILNMEDDKRRMVGDFHIIFIYVIMLVDFDLEMITSLATAITILYICNYACLMT